MSRNTAALAEDEVAVRVARLDVAEPRARELASHLSDDERARAGRFVLAVHRRRFAVARGLLRETLAEAVGAAPAALAFAYAEDGKPRLAERGAPCFNLSHSDEVLLIAWARRRELGADVEAVREAIDHAAIAARFFSAAERAVLAAAPAGEGARAFFTIWTRKEAFVKLRGGGLRIPLDSFDVSLDEPARLLRAEGPAGSPAGVALASVAAPPGFCAAVAAEGGPVRLRASVL